MKSHNKLVVIAAAVTVCIMVALGVVALTNADNGSSTPTALTSAVPTSSGHPSAPLGVSAKLAKLSSIPIKGRAPKTGYDRALFGTAWTDDVTVPGGHNGCDTRNDRVCCTIR